MNTKVKKFAAEKSIVIDTTTPYSPSQHSTAERMNRTLLELTCAMLIERKLPPSLWAEAVTHATYIPNCSPMQALGDHTPFEAWHGSRPDVGHFQEFGRDAWVLQQGTKPSKIEAKSHKMKFVGFLDTKKAIRFYDPTKQSVCKSRNFQFVDEVLETADTADILGLRFEREVDAAASSNPEQTQDQEDDQPEKPMEIVL